jgi:serine/threonine protein kinase
VLEDVLQPGDVVGEGVDLQGEIIRLVSPTDAKHSTGPAREFEVVRRLGAGSYAVVYQVLEVLERAPPSEDGHSSMMGHMDLDGKHSRSPSTKYGREYAIKCLSKANLDNEALTAQMDEVTIHQSLHSHPNIVTLHRTLETSSFLLLLLEYVPGEDLFYFLEQARDHYESSHTSDPADPSSETASRTPPTPGLLSTMNSSQLLSRTRLRLISSMFSQMCDAVNACHTQQVFHRDIKPENFIVTDGYTEVDGRRERKVIVKLTDFGLSTTDLESSDMDCGSAPYMSYECRNNVAPSYRPRAADVWSLGIVLINMLYHINPWTDTKEGECNSFDVFRQQPVNFFMQRFVGMTRPVAEHLANKVFNVLDDPKDDSERISAADFGIWAKDLPDLLGAPLKPGHQRAGSTASLTHGHRISCSIPLSHRPSSRQASGTASAIRTPAIQSRSLSRHGSFGPAFETAYEKPESSELSTVIDQDTEEQEEEREFREAQDKDMDKDGAESVGTDSRSASTNKRRKRGARKGKGGSQPPSSPKDETLENLATASQTLAREISRASRASSLRSNSTTQSSTRSRGRPFEPAAMYPVPLAMLSRNTPPVPPLPKIHQHKPAVPKVTPAPPAPPSDSTAAPSITKKPSKWKLSFGKSSASALGRVSPVEEPSPDMAIPPTLMSATASNVTSLIMGLDAVPPPAPSAPADEWPRGRRARLPVPPGGFDPVARRDNETYHSSRSPQPGREQFDTDVYSRRATSPNSVRSGRPLGSSASSMVSGNWRSSTSTTSSAGTSTSAFTRYSNASVRSVSTTATSVSATSWRTNGSKPQPSSALNGNVPKNVKIMNGVPWELDQLPRGQYPDPVGDIFGSPPVRQPRTRKPKDLQLGTIAERPPAPQKSPDFQRREAVKSTSDLSIPESPRDEDGDGPKKVPKAQINALAKMLSALRR